MSIDVFGETVLTLSKVARSLPRLRDNPTSPTTMWRWTQRGCKAKDGTIVRLETVRIGGTICTSTEALNRFFQRLSEAGTGGDVDLHAVARCEGAEPSSSTGPRRSRKRLRDLFDAGLLVSKRLWTRSKVPDETIFNLYLYINDRVPDGKPGEQSGIVARIREAVFAESLEILRGETDVLQGWNAAVNWIDSIDFLTCNVTEFRGINERIAAEWQRLVEDAEYRPRLRAMQSECRQ